MNIVVTGGAGFIGTHLVEKFVMRGDKVIVIDNLLTGSKKNVSIFDKYDNFSFINLDVQNYIDIKCKDYVRATYLYLPMLACHEQKSLGSFDL